MKTPKSLWKEALVFVVIGLFVGASVIPAISSNIIQSEEKEDFKSNNMETSDLTDGLVGYWSFDEIIDGIAPDESGNGNDGLIYGYATITLGVSGYGLRFDGGYVDIGNDSSLKPDLPITISTWICCDGFERNMVIFLNDKAQGSSNFYGVRISIVDGVIDVGFYDGGSDNVGAVRSKRGETTLEDPFQWYHVVAVFSGSTDMNIYINGINDGGTYSGSGGSISYSDSHGYIGPNFIGRLDEVRVYNIALNEDEVFELYRETFTNHLLVGKITGLSSDEHSMHF